MAKLVQYMPVKPSCSTPSLLATPRNYWKQAAAGGGYRAHLRVVTANSFSLVVGRSGPRNRRLGRAWGTTGITLFSHSQTHPHAEAPQCRMHGSTEMYASSGSLASVVLVGGVSRHHEEALSPGTADKYSPLQITAAAFLTSSAGPVMGQLSIGRFADPSRIIRLHTNRGNTDPTCSIWHERPLRRTSGDIHSCSVRSTSSAAAHSPNSFTSASAPPSPTSPSCSPGQPVRPASAPCSSRHKQSVTSTHPSRGAATSATPASSRPHRHPAAPCHQCRRCRAAPRSHHGSRRVHHHRQRSATESTMSALATPVEQCPARTVNRMQTLPVANGGTIKGPSGGCTSRRSACGLTAAGTTSFSRMIPCAEDTTLPSHSQLPFNEFIAWYLSEIQYFPVSSRSLVDTLMRMGIHPSLPMTVYGCSAPTAQKGASLTTTRIQFVLSERITYSTNRGYVKVTAKHPLAITP
ncbi:regulator of sigma E protease [Trypanosoma cruzi]|nr:regulator of sigma E protease [Trypanosoma cruzi]